MCRSCWASSSSAGWCCGCRPATCWPRAFINDHLFGLLHRSQDHLHPSRPGNKDDGGHVEQKNWTRVRELVGCMRLRQPSRAV